MSICQAFGSNTFNLCIGLGLVWLIEAAMGECAFGAFFRPSFASCAGCYMPSGFEHACPHLEAYQPPRQSGSLQGTSVVVFFNILLLLITFTMYSCRIPKQAAYVFFVVYSIYVVYQVGAVYEAFPPFCLADDLCL